MTVHDVDRQAHILTRLPDCYISQHSFYGWRRIAQLAQLGALYSDVDYRKIAQWQHVSPEWVVRAILERLDDARVPAMSYAMATGQGLALVWLHDLVPRAALPRWQAMQKRLYEILRPFGADARALDAARVLRISGTIHGTTGNVVRPVWSRSPDIWRWDFEELAGEILPLHRAEIHSLSIERAKRRAAGKAKRPAHRLDAASYWEAVLTDLQALRRLRWWGPLPSGQRDIWLFLAVVAMSWLVPAGHRLTQEAEALAQEAGGWDARETRNRLGSVLRRALSAAKGETVEFNGQSVDARYRFKSSTIVDWLEITPEEMRTAGLRVLVDSERARELVAERQRNSRVMRKVPGRTLMTAAERHACEQARLDQLAGLSRAMRNKGMTFMEIASELGVSKAYIGKLLKRPLHGKSP